MGVERANHLFLYTFPSLLITLNITPKSTKQEIIEESVVIIADQDQLIDKLKEQQFILFGIISVLLIANFF